MIITGFSNINDGDGLQVSCTYMDNVKGMFYINGDSNYTMEDMKREAPGLLGCMADEMLIAIGDFDGLSIENHEIYVVPDGYTKYACQHGKGQLHIVIRPADVVRQMNAEWNTAMATGSTDQLKTLIAKIKY